MVKKNNKIQLILWGLKLVFDIIVIDDNNNNSNDNNNDNDDNNNNFILY